MESFENNKVSIIFRTLGVNKKNIERAIFSVFCSTYKEKELIIVYQGNNGNEFESYVDYLRTIYGNEIDFKLCINSNYLEDQRAKNINIGINNASGRFICILDDDDFIASKHYEELINLIKSEKYAWGYSICMRNICDGDYIIKKENTYYFDYDHKEFLISNFIPIHIFIVDRNAVLLNPEIIKTEESLTRLEDYFILLNLASKYNPIINKKNGVFYNFQFTKEEDNKICEEYIIARKFIETLKADLNNKIKVKNITIPKPNKSIFKILYRLLIISIYFSPFFGKKLFPKNRRVLKFVDDISLSVKSKR